MKTINKIVIILIFTLSLFISGCETSKKNSLYIEMNEEVFINEDTDILVYYNSELISWDKLDYTLSDFEIGEVINGKFISKKYGSCIITVVLKDNPNVFTSFSFKVVPPYVKDIIVEGKNEVYIDKKIELNAKVIPSVITSPIEWISSDDYIISVSEGIVYGVGVGEAYLILKCDEFEKKIKITVLPSPTSIEITGNNKINVGEVETFSYNIDEEIILSSSNNETVKVLDNTIVGIKTGNATITAYRKDKPTIKGTIEIEVVNDITKNNMTIEEKKTIDKILENMSLEQMVGEMFILDFISEKDWQGGYQIPQEDESGLPYAQYGSRVKTIREFLSKYPIGNFGINEYNLDSKEHVIKSTNFLNKLAIEKTGVSPFIVYNNSVKGNALTNIPSNIALASTDNVNDIEKISELHGSELKALGINVITNNYISYNNYSSYYKNNTFGKDINKANIFSNMAKLGYSNSDVTYVPLMPGGYDQYDDRDPINIYDTDYTLFNKAVVNNCNLMGISNIYYTNIKDQFSITNGEFMQGLIRNKFNYQGALMIDKITIENMYYRNEFYDWIKSAINLGLDMIEAQLYFTSRQGNAGYYEKRNLRILNLFDYIVECVKKGDINQDRIVEANERILLAKLRNNALSNETNDSFDFKKSKQNIKKLTPNFVTKIGELTSVDYDKSTMFISENYTVTNTKKTCAEFYQSYFSKLGYKDSLIAHTNRLDVNGTKVQAKKYDQIFVAISYIDDNTKVGNGSRYYLKPFLEELHNINPNMCVIVLGDERVMQQLPFIENFIMTYGFYEDDFQNIFKVMNSNTKGNKNYIE